MHHHGICTIGLGVTLHRAKFSPSPKPSVVIAFFVLEALTLWCISQVGAFPGTEYIRAGPRSDLRAGLGRAESQGASYTAWLQQLSQQRPGYIH